MSKYNPPLMENPTGYRRSSECLADFCYDWQGILEAAVNISERRMGCFELRMVTNLSESK